MKKMLKIMALVLVLATLLCTPIFAGGAEANLPDAAEQQSAEVPSGEVSPLTAPCVYCDEGTMTQTESYSTSWYTLDYITCQCEGGHAPMQDEVQERTVTIVMTCGSCGLSDSDTSVQSRTEHLR